MKLKLITPLRLGLLGMAFFIGAVAGVAFWSYLAKRNDPPGWIMDRAIPGGAYYLAEFAALLVVSALVWAIAAWAKRRFSKWVTTCAANTSTA
ncbi:MAG TPA: hypothetical protein VOA41_22025 [Candidatus Dormibacteraeota bacterium]|nr:hypothetical protein [Candidatus Dormibacteraeota bacterium]